MNTGSSSHCIKCARPKAKQVVAAQPKLSFAQLRGLVAAPAMPLTDAEWTELEAQLEKRFQAAVAPAPVRVKRAATVRAVMLQEELAGEEERPSASRPAPSSSSSATKKRLTGKGERKGLEKELCSVCMEPFALREVLLTSCCHLFHRSCLQSFENFQKANDRALQCPICRKEAYEKRLTRQAAKFYILQSARRLQAAWRGHRVRQAFYHMRRQLYLGAGAAAGAEGERAAAAHGAAAAGRWLTPEAVTAAVAAGLDPSRKQAFMAEALGDLSSRLKATETGRQKKRDEMMKELDDSVAASRKAVAAAEEAAARRRQQRAEELAALTRRMEAAIRGEGMGGGSGSGSGGGSGGGGSGMRSSSGTSNSAAASGGGISASAAVPSSTRLPTDASAGNAAFAIAAHAMSSGASHHHLSLSALTAEGLRLLDQLVDRAASRSAAASAVTASRASALSGRFVGAAAGGAGGKAVTPAASAHPLTPTEWVERRAAAVSRGAAEWLPCKRGSAAGAEATGRETAAAAGAAVGTAGKQGHCRAAGDCPICLTALGRGEDGEEGGDGCCCASSADGHLHADSCSDVLLSCSHIFHSQCIASLEAFASGAREGSSNASGSSGSRSLCWSPTTGKHVEAAASTTSDAAAAGQGFGATTLVPPAGSRCPVCRAHYVRTALSACQ